MGNAQKFSENFGNLPAELLHEGVCSAGCSLVLSTMFTYTYIYRQMRRMERRMSRIAQAQRQGKQLLIPLWIILTNIIFVIIPSVTYEILRTVSSVDTLRIVVLNISLLSDCCCGSNVVIYVFLDASLRRRFLHMLPQSNQVAPLGERRATLVEAKV